jgi:hypothetical protein
MLSLINILIIFFIILISYQIILAKHVIEGAQNNKYDDYDTSNPSNALILSQKNAGNIEYLKERINNLQGTNSQSQINDLSGNVQTLQQQVNGLVSQQQQYASQVSGGTAPEVSGTETDNPPDTSDLVTPD